MDEKLQEKLKYLRLIGLISNWDNYMKLIQKKNLSHIAFLKHIIDEEYQMKKENARKMRMARAKIPEQFSIETFPFAKQPKLNKKRILALYDSFDYVSKQQNVIWIGPTGAGKSGLASSFLTQAINKGHTGRFISFPELVEELYRSVGDHSERKVIKTFSSYDCLLIDELGYVEVEPIQVGMFFTLMSKRHKKKTTLITSNLGFGEWTSFLKNEQLTAAPWVMVLIIF
ncbi:ATPase AAA [Candidatus Magnetomorum sp. HK-1]|nr:ATPase AAA [Candidatus Magnetomorum sp. HK-1]